MNYELAKELKDAGFPYSNTWEEKTHWFERENHIVPTLSELIEVCGEKFEYLNRESNQDWYVNNIGDPTENKEITPMYYGHSPEEAVARLWLALNKKSVNS